MAVFFAKSTVVVLLAVVCVFSKTCYGWKLPSLSSLKAVNQTLIALGGETNKEDGFTDTLDIYSLTTNSFVKNGASAPSRRAGFGSVLVNNTIYVMGGRNAQVGCDNTFWSYDIAQNVWNVNLPTLPTYVKYNALVELDGKIYVLGGSSAPTSECWETKLQDVYAYDMRLNQWSTLSTSIPETAIGSCAVTQANNIYYMTDSNTFYRSSDEAKTWQQLASPSKMDAALVEVACVAVGREAILRAAVSKTNDYQDLFATRVDVYNTTTDVWKTVAPMQTARFSAPLVVLQNEDVMVCGGTTEQLKRLKTCEVYDWKENKWSKTDLELEEARADFGLFVTQANTA